MAPAPAPAPAPDDERGASPGDSGPGGLQRIAIAGSTGFVGRATATALAARHEVVALGRRVAEDEAPTGRPGRRWRRCDLFSIRQTQEALEGVDVALYLVHSMSPNVRLTQGRFEDLDLVLADNFGRACAGAGVKRIVYLGGLVPSDPSLALSPHLASRVEVEHALGAHGVPVTAVRASLVVGSGGSSLELLVKLVKRLPVMICPSWTRSRTQPIALEDVVEALVLCCEDPSTAGRVGEIGGPDVLTYRSMMQETARVLGRRRFMLPVPLVTPGLSRLWVSLVTRTPRQLVGPLIESLQHDMVVESPWLQSRMPGERRSFESSLRAAVRSEGLTRSPVARSVQRHALPAGCDATWAAHEYLRWLPRTLRPLLRVERDAGRTGGPDGVEREEVRIGLRGLRRPLLVLEYDPERSGPDRALFLVTGGLLAGPPTGLPRLEFRTTPREGEILAILQDFRPRLPWWLYTLTQARAHLWVMWRFGRHLRRLAERPA